MNIAPGAPIRQNVTAVAGSAYGVIGADLHVFGDGTPLYLFEEHHSPEALDRAWLRELPSRMLNARTGVVAFTGRDRERDELRAWRESEPRLAVRWLHAPGGQGKTRLADHVAALATADGWKAVMAVPDVGTAGPLPGSQDLRLDGCRGVLLIVDYADRWPLSALIWLLRNSLIHQYGKPARVLLLARGTAAWPALRATLEDHRVRASTSERYLDPLAADNDGGRWAMFTAARDAFADIYQIRDAAAVASPVSLDRPELGLTLTVHVAALVAVDAHATGDQPATDPDLLTRYLLDREREHWARLYEGRRRGLDHRTPDSAMARTVFTAALTGPLAHPEATTLLGRVEQELPAEQILTDHTRCYPPTDRARATVLEPLYPDRLAEDFIAHTLPGPNHPAEAWAPTRLDHLLKSPPPPSTKRRWWQARPTPPPAPAYTARVVTFLTAATARWPHLGPAHLYPLLRARPQLAITAGDATLSTLAVIPNVDIGVLKVIEALLDCHVDLDIGTAAISTITTPHRLTTAGHPAEQARLHANHARRLRNAGRWEEARASSEEAVAIYRCLADPKNIDPAESKTKFAVSLHHYNINTARCNMKLVESLVGLGDSLSELGRLDEALASTEEAVAINRVWEKIAREHLHLLEGIEGAMMSGLVGAEGALRSTLNIAYGVHPAELARSLHRLGIRLSELGRWKKALAPTEEANRIYHSLADLPGHAASLLSLGVCLSKLGRGEEALTATSEAVEIYRRLATKDPAAFEPGLAQSLHSLVGIRLSKLGRPEQALAPAEEATRIYRRLAEANPDAYLPNLARSLWAYAWACVHVDVDMPGALAAVTESIGLYEPLARQLPQFAGDLSGAQQTRTDIIERLDRNPEP